jgi:ubiquinone/menaquinone biosynthesis C-methylase UbiE
MSRLETWVVNSPFRVPFAYQEIRRFQRLAALVRGLRMLEVGCGAGLTTRAIIDVLKPSHLSAFDFSDEQVARARRRIGKSPAIDIRQADATAMPYDDGSFDAVLEIGILHHIPSWRQAIPEVARVLKPSGTFCFAEPSKGRLTRGMYRMFPHPREAMFERDELVDEMNATGLTVRSISSTMLWNIFGYAHKIVR